jgi:ribonuclease R
VRIVVLKASLEERKIDFRLVEEAGTRKGAGDAAAPAARGKPARRKKQPY